MKIGKFEIQWSDVGKTVAGIAAIAVSYTIFTYASGWLKIFALVVLVAMFFLHRHLLMRSRMSPNLEKSLKGENDRKKYG